MKIFLVVFYIGIVMVGCTPVFQEGYGNTSRYPSGEYGGTIIYPPPPPAVIITPAPHQSDWQQRRWREAYERFTLAHREWERRHQGWLHRHPPPPYTAGWRPQREWERRHQEWFAVNPEPQEPPREHHHHR